MPGLMSRARAGPWTAAEGPITRMNPWTHNRAGQMSYSASPREWDTLPPRERKQEGVSTRAEGCITESACRCAAHLVVEVHAGEVPPALVAPDLDQALPRQDGEEAT